MLLDLDVGVDLDNNAVDDVLRQQVGVAALANGDVLVEDALVDHPLLLHLLLDQPVLLFDPVDVL